jgi:5'-3' exonuclease
MRFFLIVDADGLAFKSYYALEQKVDFPMAFGVLRSVVKILNDFEPDKLALVFDSDDEELKHIYPGYRRGREEPWDLGMEDYVYMLEILAGLGFKVYKDGREADRVIAGLVNTNEDDEICIYSDDKDFFQLLEGQRVWMFGEHRGEVFCSDVVREFELPRGQCGLFRELLIFTGDPVDRVPRILRTADAYEVIWRKGYLEDWFFDEDFDGLPQRIQDILVEKYDEVVRNYKLVNLMDETRADLYERTFGDERLEEVLEKVGLGEGDVERALEWVSILR